MALGEELLAIARDEGDRTAEADACFLLSRAAGMRGVGAEATAFVAEAVALCRELGDERRLPWALQRLGIEAYAAGILGVAQHALGDRAQAAVLYRESLTLH